jgi:hypothetical protein
MDMVPVFLIPTAAAADQEPDPECVLDALWAAAAPDDRLEHITLLHGPGRFEVVMFHLTSSAERGEQAAIRLCARACAQAPLLQGWTVGSLVPARIRMSIPLPPRGRH